MPGISSQNRARTADPQGATQHIDWCLAHPVTAHRRVASASSAACILAAYAAHSTTLFAGAAVRSTASAAGVPPSANRRTMPLGQLLSAPDSALRSGPVSCETARERVDTKQCMLAVERARRQACLSTKKLSSSMLVIIEPCTQVAVEGAMPGKRWRLAPVEAQRDAQRCSADLRYRVPPGVCTCLNAQVKFGCMSQGGG